MKWRPLAVARYGTAQRQLPDWLQSALYGFLFWLVFLLVLEPDNLLRAGEAGSLPTWHREVIRIAGAALIGAAVAPVLFRLIRRYSLLTARPWRNGLILVLANCALAFALIVVSCFAAAWLFEHRWAPTPAELRVQLTSNLTLLFFALWALTAIVHLAQRLSGAPPAGTARQLPEQFAPAIGETASARIIPVKTGGRTQLLELSRVDWIESQGNYVALHYGDAVRLVRSTLTDFEARLDAGEFARIHRRTIVAISRIQDMKPLANGDASLRLLGGRELRVSRNYRETVRERWSTRRSL